MRSNRRPAGLTLIEILVAMTLTVAVFAITLPFLKTQTEAIGRGASRMDADQVARYAVTMIDRDLRRASADSGQPLLVLAAPRAIVFTADLLAADANGVDAVDIDLNLSASATTAWRLANAAALPTTGRTFPTRDYLDRRGAVSGRETISYWLSPDTVAGRTDLFVLWRRVNAGDSSAVVRELVLPTDTAFFAYERPDTVTTGGVLGRGLRAIAGVRLPLYWDSLAIDSIRAVSMRATGRYRDARTGVETTSTVRFSTMLVNSPGRLLSDCGVAPTPPTSPVSIAESKNNDGLWEVKVSWSPSTDDAKASGARDVRGYALEWSTNGGTAWSTLTTVPARRQSKYFWFHGLPVAGTTASVTAQYRARAIDCGGLFSSAISLGSVTF